MSGKIVFQIPCPTCGGTGYVVRLDNFFDTKDGVSGRVVRVRISKRDFVREARKVIESPQARNRFRRAVVAWCRRSEKKQNDPLVDYAFADRVVHQIKHIIETNKIMEEPCPSCNTTGWSLRATTCGTPVRDSHDL